MNIRHSKLKNTGILFETIVKKITSDTLSHGDSPSVGILKKYFVNTELGKEYKLYETVFKQSNITETKANLILDTVLEHSKTLNRSKLKREKYNLIKALSEHYDVEDLFRIKIKEYKQYAALYTLFEIYNTPKQINPDQIIDNKVTILEHLTESKIEEDKVKDNVIKEFMSYDKDVRILTYRILLEKFNEKYSGLNKSQKNILHEFITNTDNPLHLKSMYNKEVEEIKTMLENKIKSSKDKVLKIKLNEVNNLLKLLDKKDKINTDHLVDLLQYHSLLEELK